MSMSEVYLLFFTLIKLCYTKALEQSNLVPGPEAKSLEIMNPISFTVNYHYNERCLHYFLLLRNSEGFRSSLPEQDKEQTYIYIFEVYKYIYFLL